MIAILGAGKMGEALLSGVLRAGRSPSELMATVRREERGALLRERYGIEIVSNRDAAATAETLILAVKPQDMGALLDEVGPHVPPGRLVISAAAGITTGFIEERLPEGVPVVRVMSNTPVLVDQAMSVISPGSHAGEEHLKLAEELLAPVGKVLRIPDLGRAARPARPPGDLGGGGDHHGVHRGAAAGGRARRPRHVEHARPRGPGDERHLARVARGGGAPEAGGGAARAGGEGAAHPRV